MRGLLGLLMLASAGCTLPTQGLEGGDAEPSMDADAPDAGEADAEVPDGGQLDAGAPDGGRLDADMLDAGAPDGGAPDTGAPDGGVDAGPGCVPTGPDVCNGLDDDCDPATADGSADPVVACDGPDADLCAEGVTGCAGGMPTCSDTTGATSETCDGADEDCDGAIDEGASCPCPRVAFGGGSYLFCGTDDYAGARRRCGDTGYALATITTDAEQDFVHGEATSRGGGDHWLGADDIASEGTFAWEDGTPFTYTNWGPDQPNDDMRPADEDCLMLRTSATGSRRPGGWFDQNCSDSLGFVCEARP